MRLAGLLLVLVTPALAHTQTPAADSAWVEPCVKRLEAARAEAARLEPRFAEATVKAHKVDGGCDSVALTMTSKGPAVDDFWIEVTDMSSWYLGKQLRMEPHDWAPIKRTPELTDPTLVKDLPPMKARMQGNQAVTPERWRTFLERFQKAVEQCLAREL